MVELHSIPGVLIEDDFHDFATEYLSLQRSEKCGLLWEVLKKN